MSEARVRALMLGLPKSGKTTFLAAVWHVVNTGDVDGALELETVGPHSHYLNDIWTRWLVGEDVGRTTAGGVEESSMTLVAAGETSAELTIPDLSGEHSKAAFLNRQWPPELEPIVSSADGVVVFVHAEEIEKPRRISDALFAVGNQNEADPVSVVPWDAEATPTAVKVVDLLQLLSWSLAVDARVRVAIVASAWDLAEAEFATPEVWLETQLPLLHQFLASNQSTFDYKLFGVSAQGGSLKAVAQRLVKAFDRPSERIKVVDDNGHSSHDVTLPLRWALSI